MTNTIAIIDYGSGNLRSAHKAFEFMVRETELNARVILTSDPADVRGADKIILPGQGAFGDCMDGLTRLEGMIDALENRVKNDAIPFFGICVGMQLLATTGFEHGTHKGLGWIEADVTRMTPNDPKLKIPHMGWNELVLSETGETHPVLRSIKKASAAERNFYFVHSFVVNCKHKQHILAQCDYGGAVTALIGRDNLIGIQGHPEKSQRAGLSLIGDFLCWTP